MFAVLAPLAPTCRATDTVIVPYDSHKPVAGQTPDGLYVPYEEFLNLWEAAKAHRRGPQPETIPVPFAFTAARYDGRLTDRLITFAAQLDLLTGGADAWRSVPVPFRGVKLTSLTLDGETAVMKGADVLVEKPGRHRLTATFEIPFARGATEFRWGIPPSAATLVTLKLPDPAMSATIAPGSGSV